MRLTRGVVRCVAIGASALLAIAACENDGPDADPVSRATSVAEDDGPLQHRDVVDGIDVETDVTQQRHLEGTDRIVVVTTVHGADEVHVRSIVLDTPYFEALAAEPKSSRLTDGLPVALQVDVGTPICPPGDASPQVSMDLDLGQRTETISVPLPSDFLADLNAERCDQRAVDEAVAVTFADNGIRDGRSIGTAIELTRRSGTGASSAVTITKVAGSVILPMAADGLPTGLGPGESAGSVPVEVVAGRCDPHGLSGSQRTFVFSVWIAVGDATPVHVEISPDTTLQALMREAIDACVADGTDGAGSAS